MTIEVKTDKGDVFTMPFPEIPGFLDKIMATDYPDARVTHKNLRIVT